MVGPSCLSAANGIPNSTTIIWRYEVLHHFLVKFRIPLLQSHPGNGTHAPYLHSLSWPPIINKFSEKVFVYTTLCSLLHVS